MRPTPNILCSASDYVLWKITPRLRYEEDSLQLLISYKLAHRKRNSGRKIDFASQLISLESIPPG